MSYDKHPTARGTFGPLSIDYPATVVYSQNFETSGNTDFWMGYNSATITTSTYGTPSSGRLRVSSLLAGAGDQVGRTFTGLEIGHPYTFSYAVSGRTYATPVIAYLAGTTPGTPVATVTAFATRTFTFTATATTHEVRFYKGATAAGVEFLFDDVTLTRNAWTNATAMANVKVSEGNVSLDSGRVPYGSASITVPLTDVDLVERLKPYAGQRLSLTAASDGHWNQVAPVYSVWTNVRYNWAPDPRALSLSSFGSATLGTRSLITDMPGDINTAIRWTRTSTGAARALDLTVGTAFPAFGQTITVAGIIRSNLAGANIIVSARPTISTATGAVTLGTITIAAAGVPQAFSFTGTSFTAATTSTSGLVLTNTTATGTTVDVTAFQIETNAGGVFFDGATPDLELIRYEWLGTANASTSAMQTRTILIPSFPLWVEDNARTFNLAITSRDASHDGKTITVEADTDEAILQNYRDVTDDIGAFAYQDSIRGVVNYVLAEAIPGAALEAGTPNPSVRTYTPATNLLQNPGTEFAASAGTYSGGNATIDYNDATWSISYDGDSFNIYSPTAADSWMSVEGAAGARIGGLTDGKTYVFSATGNVKAVTTGELAADATDAGGTAYKSRARALIVHTRVGAGAYGTWHSPQVPNVINTPTRVSVEFTVPAGATEVFLRAYLGGTAGQVRWDGFSLVEKDTRPGVDNTVFFSGDTPDTAEYLYQWTGAADGSKSTRTPLIDRAPELLIWEKGTSAWEFISPIVNSAGLRLFCDEQRKWRLIDPTEYAVPGRFTAQTNNTVSGTDTISITSGLYATGVIVTYEWIDSQAVKRTQTDTAGTGPYVDDSWVVKRPYPGPGLAEARLRKLQGQGRTQAVTTGSDFTVTPGQEVAISLPGTYDQLGTLQSVTWNLADGTQDIGSIGLVETPPGAIDLLPGTIDGLPGTIDSL